jgi:hypothetical protein
MSAVDLQNSLITVNVALSGIPVPAAGFGTVMLVSPDAAPGGAALVLTYTSATASTALAADLTAAKITAAIKRAVETAFAQNPRPATVKVGKVPALADPSTLATDMAAIVAQDNDFYGVCLDCSVAGLPIAVQATIDANIAALAGWIETQQKVYLAMSYDVNVYAADGGAAKDIKDLGYENSALIWSQLVVTSTGYPGTNFQFADMAALCRWLAWDPDVISAPFRAGITGILRARTTLAGLDLTSAEIALAHGHNANLGLLYGSAACFVDQGVNAAGRAWEEVLSKHWLQARVREDLASTVVDLAARARKFPLTQEGVAICKGILARRFQQGVSGGHFSSYEIGSGTIDTTTKKITIAASATVLDNTRSFVFNVDFL